MLPIILGGVALATVGYGVKVCFDEQEDLKDELRRCKREYLRQQQEKSPKLSEFDSQKLEFQNLYKYKHKIRDEFEKQYNIVICSKKEIKEERLVQDVILDSDIMSILSKYNRLIKIIYEIIVKMKEDKGNEEKLSAFIHILKKFFITKIIKKGKLNKKANKLILEAAQLINEKSHMHITVRN